MRVVGGSARGKTLHAVPGKGTRPILDRVKTALFDILRPRLPGIAFLDLFAGTGGVGIEALSQGAGSCVFLDGSHGAIKTIHENLATTGLANRAEVHLTDAFSYLRSSSLPFDLIYVAPPQYQDLWKKALQIIDSRPELLRHPEASDDEARPPLVIVQIDPREYAPVHLDRLRETRRARYGNTLLVFFEA